MTTLDFEPLTITVPLREEPAGALRVGKSRVLLELVIRKFKEGATPEAIVQSYDTCGPKPRRRPVLKLAILVE